MFRQRVMLPQKRTAEKFTRTTLFNVSIDSCKNISNGLNFVTQTWRWLTKVIIKMPVTDGVDLSVRSSRNQTITKAIPAWLWNCTGWEYLGGQNFVAFIKCQKISRWDCILNKDNECLRRIRSYGRTYNTVFLQRQEGTYNQSQHAQYRMSKSTHWHRNTAWFKT